MRAMTFVALAIAGLVLGMAILGTLAAIMFFADKANRFEGGGSYAIAAAILIGMLWVAAAIFLRPHSGGGKPS